MKETHLRSVGSACRLKFSAEERSELLTLYDNSGQSRAAFAREYGLNYQTFASWIKQRRLGLEERKSSPCVAGKSDFAEVSMGSLPVGSSARWQWELSLSDGEVIRSNCSVSDLASLLKSLKAEAPC